MSQWQDIDSAPMDGTWVLTWSEKYQHMMQRCEPWMQGMGEGWKPFTNQTHWMPLPDVPK